VNPISAGTIYGPLSAAVSELISARRVPQRLSGTGTTEASNAASMLPGKYATLVVGDTPVRYALADEPGISNAVATTDIIIPANSSVTWTVGKFSRYAYVEAADGSSAYEAWVFQSSP
jgi:hypothetical protein